MSKSSFLWRAEEPYKAYGSQCRECKSSRGLQHTSRVELICKHESIGAVDCWMLSRTAIHKRLCGKWKAIAWLSALPNPISWTLATDNRETVVTFCSPLRQRLAA